MRKWNVAALLLALGLIAPMSVAQTPQTSNDDLKKMVEDMRRELDAVKADNVELRSKVATTAIAGDTTLEERVNALSDSLDYAGCTVNCGANPITIFGSFRTRSAWTFDRDFGAFNGDAADDSGGYVDANFLVGFDFQVDPDVKTRFSMKSNGLYENGSTPGSEGDGSLGEIDLYEGYIEFSNIFGRKELGTREGRQEIVLGNEYQFGNNDWFSGETFDGSHWWWNSDNFTIHFLWAKMATDQPGLNVANNSYPISGLGNGYDDDEMYSLYFTLKSIQDFVLDVYWIYFNGHNGGSDGTLGNGLGSPSTGDVARDGGGFDFYYHTFGARVAGVFAVACGLDYNLEVAYQTGDFTDGTNLNVDDFSVEGELGLTFSEESRFRIYLRGMFAEGASGNDSGYIPLFPERHSIAGDSKFAKGDGNNGSRRARYGIMDIIPMDNVWSIQLGATFDPSHDWTLGLTVLYAEHDEDVATTAGTLDNGIGFEVDAFAEWRYTKHTSLGGGIGAFFPDGGAPLNGGGFVGNNDDSVAFLFFLQARVAF